MGDKEVSECEPNELGEKVLSIWNERVAAIRKIYKLVRTVVLIKSDDLLELSAFEFNTIFYPPENYFWKWNKRNNLEGYLKTTEEHKFTWQPHGSQFTIIKDVPDQRLVIKIKKPPMLDRDTILKALKFDNSWIKIINLT